MHNHFVQEHGNGKEEGGGAGFPAQRVGAQSLTLSFHICWSRGKERLLPLLEQLTDRPCCGIPAAADANICIPIAPGFLSLSFDL